MITVVVWTLLGHPDQALIRTITVLVVACPHALGLAIPLVVAIATERAARGGVLITDRQAMESMRTVDVVVFDKTGTLTKGEPAVDHVHAVDGDSDALLALAASAEADSEHPVARAIVAAAAGRSLSIPAATEFTATTGVGVRAVVDGRTVRVGGPALLRDAGTRAAARDRGLVGAGRDRAARGDRRSARPAPSVCRTRSGPSLARPSTPCTPAVGGWS